VSRQIKGEAMQVHTTSDISVLKIIILLQFLFSSGVIISVKLLVPVLILLFPVPVSVL
jgi:hypothetical protein